MILFSFLITSKGILLFRISTNRRVADFNQHTLFLTLPLSVCPSSIYGFWLHFLYFKIFTAKNSLCVVLCKHIFFSSYYQMWGCRKQRHVLTIYPSSRVVTLEKNIFFKNHMWCFLCKTHVLLEFSSHMI